MLDKASFEASPQDTEANTGAEPAHQQQGREEKEKRGKEEEEEEEGERERGGDGSSDTPRKKYRLNRSSALASSTGKGTYIILYIIVRCFTSNIVCWEYYRVVPAS